ncbi:MAG: TetR/AcrR family transcriptional regulator [Myxococcota bacterium]|jgi:TetR/AcrR family transcriptional regulator
MNQSVDDVRSRILQEAVRLFAARGVAGTSIQSIAAAAGITRPTLVYHFGSKAGLRTAVLRSVVDHWRRELPRLLADAASRGGPRLDALLAALFDFFHKDPHLARLIVREMLDQPDELGVMLREELLPWTRLIADAIRFGQESGTLRSGVHPESFTTLMISSALAVVTLGAHAGSLVSPAPSVDEQQAELLRVARVALLAPRSPAPEEG